MKELISDRQQNMAAIGRHSFYDVTLPLLPKRVASRCIDDCGHCAGLVNLLYLE